MAAVQRWPTPTCQKEVEQFLGLAGYYRRFIAGLQQARLAALAAVRHTAEGEGRTRRTPPRKPFVWGAEQQEAFECAQGAR